MAESIALTVAGEKIGGCLIEHVQRELGYLFCFNSNIQELETGLDQLILMRNDVKRSEDEARSSRKTRGEVADGWIIEANKNITEAQEFINEKLPELQKGCFSIKWCPNIKMCFSLGRKGKKLSLHLKELLDRGDKLPQTVLPLRMPSINMRDYNGDASAFHTRRKPMEEIIKMLRDKETRLIGICGMGGIGKTTFANQVLQKVQNLHLFDKQVISSVSSDPNFNTIQQEVVEMLGGSSHALKEIESKILRAQQLRSAFSNKKVVVLLDDVWKEFDLNALGFPLSNSDVCCKIIYTSRTQDLWLGQGTIKKKDIPLDILSGEESLDLFIREANLNNDDDDFQMKNGIAMSIVDECKGLPLALKVAGSALIKKETYHWNNMLSRLKNHHDHESKINEVLKTSYDSLEDNNEKLLFLFCCLFKEDTTIYIERLYRYAAGLQLFKDMTSLREIRDCVYTLVGNLIKRNLLIKEIDYSIRPEMVVKMHDVVRDVGITLLIKDIDYLGYFVGDGLNDLENVIGTHAKTKMISILFRQMDLKIFNKMGFRDTKFELVKLDDYDYSDHAKKSEDFLKVLDIVQTYNGKEFSYFSFPNMVKLKMLSLESLEIKTNLSSIRHLSCLEILSFRWSNMEVLPNEISELTNLRLLDMTACRCFINKGILSKLTNLQELCMWYSFLDWRVPNDQSPQGITDENKNAAAELNEINLLNKLWRLELEVSRMEQVQKGVTLFPFSKSLEYFKIRIGDNFSNFQKYESGDRQLLLRNTEDKLSEEFGDIIRNKITKLSLYKGSVIWKNMHLKEFLKDVVLVQCESLIALFPHSQSSPSYSLSPSFSSNGLGLSSIRIFECHQMRHLVDISILRHLKKLQFLYIRNCGMMEEVVSFCEDREEHKIIEFKSLKTLKLNDLCRLKCFCKGINEVHFDKLKTLELKSLKQFIFPVKLEVQCLKELVIESIPNIKSLCNFWSSSLERLTIGGCEDFIYAFSFTTVKEMERNISYLSKLYITRCTKFKGLIFVSTDLEGKWSNSILFPKLRILHLDTLNELVSFVINENEEEMMQSALFYRDQVSFPCLQELKINGLSKINYIISRNDKLHQYHPKEGYTGEIQSPLFPNLKVLSIAYLMELVSFGGVVNNMEDNGKSQNVLFHPQVSFPCLQELYIEDLPKINYIVGCNDRLYHHHRHIEEYHGESQSSLFPGLKRLSLISLEKLLSFVEVVNTNMDDNGEKQNALFDSQVAFSCLEVLVMNKLPKINYIVGWNGRLYHCDHRDIEESYKEIQPQLFPNLKDLTLNSLVELVSFVEVVNANMQDNAEKQNALFDPHQVSFPYLIDLRIFYLPKINYIMGYWNGLQHHGTNDNERKLQQHILLSLFPSLKYSWLKGLSNLIQIYESNHLELEVLLFQNLSQFKISECEKLRYLFTENMGREAAKNLEILDISYCPMMEVVMKNDDDNNGRGGESIYVPNNHLFPLLENLKLKYLPEMTRFCDVTYAWTLPLLKGLVVHSCPKLEALSLGYVNSPKLETLEYNGRRKNAA